MKNILFTLALFVSFSSFGQDLTALNNMVNGAKSTIGNGDSEMGIYIRDAYKEGNKTIVYDVNITKKSTADIFKNQQTKENLILNNIALGSTAFKYNIIVKYVYYFNDSVIKSFTIMPYEWGYNDEVVSNELGDYYFSNGHIKAKGLNFQIKKPTGFKQSEGVRPNIVQKWEKGNPISDEYLSIMIMVNNLDNEANGFSKDFWAKDFKSDIEGYASVFSGGNPTYNEKFYVVDNYPAVIFSGEQVVKRLDKSAKMHFTVIYVIFEDYLFQAIIQAKTRNNIENNSALFDLLINSIVFPDQYK